MSEKHQQNKTDLFPDGSDDYKLNEELKTETDSGFLSGGNILVSGEINIDQEEEDEKRRQQSSSPPPTRREDNKEKAYMHIDSGVDVCLSEKLSSLSLNHPELNDLNSNKQQQKSSSIITKLDDENRQQQQQQQPWQIYFQQDEDGDT